MTFSIIIPCYKVESYIRACLDSILAQTVNDPASPAYAPDCWEAICTDDGSPDGTGKILDEYAAREVERAVGESGPLNRREAAEMKVAEWLSGVDETTFEAALIRLVDEKIATGEYRFKKSEERESALEGARKFYREFSRKIVPLSDGRYVYFVPDERAKIRNASNAISWAEYAFHAVSNGGAKVSGKNYNERWYNPYKQPVFALIEDVLKQEKCFIRLSSVDHRYDAIVFAGDETASAKLQIVTRLDEVGNIDANLSEVTFAASSKEKKSPRLVPLTEAVRTVVHYQTATGSYPPNKGSIANPTRQCKGGRIKVVHQPNAGLSAARNAAMAQATGDWFLYLDSDDLLSPWALETALNAIPSQGGEDVDFIRGGFRTFNDGEACPWKHGDGDVKVLDLSQEITCSATSGGGFQRFMVSRKTFGDIPFVGLNWNEERPYMAKCFARGRKMVAVDCDFYGYRVRRGSITATKMNLAQQKGNLDATRICMRIYRDCGKRIESVIMRGLMMSWMEYQPEFIERFLPPEDRAEAWRYWFESLPEALQFGPMSAWRKFTIVVCRILPFRVVAMILCYFPHWLKMKGIHR